MLLFRTLLARIALTVEEKGTISRDAFHSCQSESHRWQAAIEGQPYVVRNPREEGEESAIRVAPSS